MKNILTIFLSLFYCTLFSQNLKMISLSENPSVEDFSFLKDELKNTQVVMLGEISHTDGNVFEMKTKIVEYLVHEMGYTTIAFEAGIYDLWNAEKQLKKGSKVKEVFDNSLFSIWSKAAEFQSFINFYETKKEQLKLFGFDYQITGINGTEHLVNELYNYCKINKLKIKLNQDDLILLLESITKSGMFDDEDITYNEYSDALTQLLIQINHNPINDEHFYWKQILKSLLALGENANNNIEILSTFNTTAMDNIRDRQMADNLLSYIKAYPNEKIICWGANQHFSNDISSIKTAILTDFIPMASYIKKELKNKLYSLAAITARDSVYLQHKWYKTPVQENSFEARLKQKKVPHLFITSNQEAMNKQQYNRLFSPITFIEANLSELHDGYLYFDKASISTIIDDEQINITHNEQFIPENKTISLEQSLENNYTLNEIIITGKQSPYGIIKKVIEKLGSNYPNTAFSSEFYTNVSSKIQDSEVLNFDFIANQYDRGYIGYDFRSTKKLKEIRWNIKTVFVPQSLREYHGLVYNSPIQYATFLKNRKFKKFDFILEETIFIDGEEVYVISFAISRNHSTYTRRVFLSNYSGLLYINKKDYAVLKITENWKVTEFPQSFREGYPLTGDYSKYIRKEYVNESTVTEFSKINGLYYITYTSNLIEGKIQDIQNNSLPFKIKTVSRWYNFELADPVKIKKEEHSFEKVKYNKAIWDNFKLP
ncbi:erythromycin esterase family protein [Flavobacterium rakeshii]|uniref:erythromycin esterase family protein n=1 Tax=Flavobacterium rakeshii TaxID=1038845 RepID=UPI002E7B7C53|nr:erythromycin esterase family protein [Flavobacterium rakeshii]MEE1899987.1 erythromycin esterase family protein [Flavobacterium rakeshii]